LLLIANKSIAADIAAIAEATDLDHRRAATRTRIIFAALSVLLQVSVHATGTMRPSHHHHDDADRLRRRSDGARSSEVTADDRHWGATVLMGATVVAMLVSLAI